MIRGSIGARARKIASGVGAGTIVAQFNLTNAAQSISDWVDIAGNPDAAIVTGSDSRSGSQIGITTVDSTDTAYWTPLSTNSGIQTLTGTALILPTELYRSYFFQYAVDYVPGKEQLQISGLNPTKTYKFEILSTRQNIQDARTSTIYIVDNVGSANSTAVSDDSVKNFNFTFTGKVPTSGGVIKIGLQKTSPTNFCYINAIRITQEN